MVEVEQLRLQGACDHLEPDILRAHRLDTIASSSDPNVMVAVDLWPITGAKAVDLWPITGAKALDLGWTNGLALSTICTVINDTLDVMIVSSPLENIKFPTSRQD